MAGRQPDVDDVFSVRLVRAVESCAQGQLEIPVRSFCARRCTVRARRPAADATRLLPGLPRAGVGSERGRLLAKLVGAAVLALRAAMVSVAAPYPERVRSGTASLRARMGRPARTAGRGGARSATAFLPHSVVRVGDRLHSADARLFAMGMDTHRPVLVPTQPAAA